MAISPVPVDIIYLIFLSLDNIDDCLHLARSCREWFAIFDRHRLPILKSAIMRSRIHQYDIQLCHFIDAYWKWASQHLQAPLMHGNPPLIVSHYQPMILEKCFKADSLSDQHVWDIVSRWQGLAVFQDIYQSPTVLGSFCRYPLIDEDSDFPPVDGPSQIRKILDEQPKVDFQDQISFIPFQAQHNIFPALYLATTRHWLLCEAIRLAKICTYPRQSEENRTWDEIYAFCTGGNSLLEAIQVLEAHDFISDYLISQLQCAKADTFTEWVQEEDFIYENETMEANWIFFLHYLRFSLSPADILQLFILTHHWRKNNGKMLEWSPSRKCQYLRERLFFGYDFPGIVWVRDVRETPDKSYTARDFEKSVELKLEAHAANFKQPWQQSWQSYRKSRWVSDARGNAFSWKFPDHEIADRMNSIKCRDKNDA